MDRKSGCDWTGELGELDRHLNLNPELGRQLIGCDFADVACTHCCERFQRRHVHAHQTDSCPQRPFSCDYCDDYISAYEDVVSNHWSVCRCYPVPCPNNCGVNPERQNVETHVNTECPLTCDFRYTGCEVQLTRKDMLTHVAENLTTHTSLLTTQTQMTSGSGAQGHQANHVLPHWNLLALHNQQLTRMTIQLKESLEECKCKIQELKQENESLKREVNEAVKNDIAQLRKETQEETKMFGISLRAAVADQFESLKQQVAELQHMYSRVLVLPIKLMMNNYEAMRRSNKVWYSPPFYTHPQGYKMCLRVDANGSGGGKGTHVSVFAHLMRGEFDDHLKWPFQGHVVIQLCNQLQDKYHRGYTIDFSETRLAKFTNQEMSGEMTELGWGTPTLIPHKDLNFNPTNNCQYLKNDCLHFQIVAMGSLSEPRVQLTMTDFERYKIDSDEWYSPPFYTHLQGYKMCLSEWMLMAMVMARVHMCQCLPT